jgi:signal peptidase II
VSSISRPSPKRVLSRATIVTMLVVALDQLTKRWMTALIGPEADRHARWLVGDTIGFEYVRNTGAAFGLFRGNPERLAAVAILVTCGLIWLVLIEVSSPEWASRSIGLLAGGSIGNMVERFVNGYVTDFVAIGPWPRFNIADAAITIGITIFVVAVIFDGIADDGEEPRTGEVTHG